MKNFRQLCRKALTTSVLVLVFAHPALAGDIPFPGVTSPPPAPVNGEIQYPGVVSPSEKADGDVQYPNTAMDSVTGMAVTLWQSAMAFF